MLYLGDRIVCRDLHIDYFNGIIEFGNTFWLPLNLEIMLFNGLWYRWPTRCIKFWGIILLPPNLRTRFYLLWFFSSRWSLYCHKTYFG